MENQIREFTKRGNRRRLFKRVVSLLCVVVLLFTMNTLKRNANTLERIAMCGLQEHTHTAGCYNSSGELVCAIPEHVHTDACYQQSPSDELVLNGDDLEIADGLVDAGDAQSLDLSLDLDQGDLLDFVQDSDAPASNVQDIGNDMPVLDGDLVFDTSYNNEETQQLAANTSVEEAQGAVDETQSEEAQQLLEEEQIAVEDGQEQPVEEETEQPVEEEQEQPVEEETEQPVEEETEQPVEEETEQPVEEAQEQPVEEETEQPVEGEQLVEEDQDQIAIEEQLVDAEQEQPAEEKVEQPAEEVQEQLVIEGQEEPVVEAQEEPVVEAQEEPVVEEQEEPAIEEQEEPAIEEQKEPVVEEQEEPAIEEQKEPVVEEQEEPVVEEQEEPAVEEQEEPVVEEQEEPVVEEQEEPVVEEQEEPVVEEQEEPVVEEQEEPVVEEQEEPVVEEQEEPVVEEQEEPVVEEQEEPVVEEQEEPVVEEQEEPVVEEQEEPVVEEQEEPVVEEQEEPVVEEQEEPVVEEQEEPVVEEQEEPVVEEQEEPVVEEQEEPVVEEQEEPVVEEQEEPVVEEQEEPVVEEQEEPVVEEQEEPAVEEQEEPAIEEQEEPAIEEAEQPAEEEAEQPAEEEAEQPAEEEAEQPAEEEAEQPAEEEAEQPAEENAEQAAEEEAEQPAEEEAEQPTEEEAEQPAEEETEEPAIEEAEQPAEVESDPEAEGESEEEPEAQIAYPAKQFQQGTAYINVSVDAPEGAFPEGTVMVVKDVEDQGTIDNIQQSVTEDFVEVTSVHAVDISFWYNDAEIEPLLPIAVVMSAVEAPNEAHETVVVHVDDNGETQLVDSEATGAAEAALEMPAAADAEAQAFQADTFSVYALVTKQAIETKYIDEQGETWRIRVEYNKEAKIPEGATLRVSEVVDDSYLAEAEAALESGKRITKARFFDIAIMYGDREVQPEAEVNVTVTLEGNEGEIEGTDNQTDTGNPDVVAMHFEEKDNEIVGVEKKNAVETEEGVAFKADGFSVWGVVYTVDFEVEGDQGEITLDFTAFDALNLPGEGDICYNTEDCSIHVALGLLSGIVDSEAEAGYDIDVNANLINNYEFDFDKAEMGKADSGIRFADGELVIASDGFVELTEGERLLRVRATGLTALKQALLETEGVSIEVISGNVPLGSEASYTAHTDEETAELVENYINNEENGDSEVAGYSAADLKIVRNDETLPVEGQFKVTVDKESLVPAGMKLDKLYHIHRDENDEAVVEELAFEETEAGLVFEVANFSDIVAGYTVDFEYTDPETGEKFAWKWPGEGSYKISDIMAQIGVEGEISDVSLVRTVDMGGSEKVLYLEEKEDGWYLTSEKAFTDTFELKITVSGTVYVVTVTDTASTTNLNDLLKSFTVTGATQNPDGSYTVKPGKPYAVDIVFQESEQTSAFDDNGNLVFTVPQGLTLSNFTSPFDINVNEAGANFTVSGNTIVANGNTITIHFNQEDPNFSKLQGISTTELRVHGDVTFDNMTNGAIYTVGTDGIFKVDSNPDVNIAKSGRIVDFEHGTVSYTLTVTSNGKNTGIIVSDTITGDALTLNQDVVMKDAGNNTLNPTVTYDGNQFELQTGALNDGTYYINYTAQLNMDKLDADIWNNGSMGTGDDTNNRIEWLDKHQDYNIGHVVEAPKVEKRAGTATTDETNGMATIPWTIEADSNYYENWKLTNVTDTIKTAGMHYSGAGITVTITDHVTGSTVGTFTKTWAEMGVVDPSTATGWTFDMSSLINNYQKYWHYKIEYTTEYDVSSYNSQVQVKNETTTNYDPDPHEGVGTVNPTHSNSTGISKSMENTSQTEVTWRITLGIPQGGLEAARAVVTEYLPSAGSYVDGYKAGSFRYISGNLSGDGTPEITDNGDGTVTFRWPNGFAANTEAGQRTLVFELKTTNNQDWMDDTSVTNNHKNHAEFDTGHGYADAFPVKPMFRKTGSNYQVVNDDLYFYFNVVTNNLNPEAIQQNGGSITFTDTFDSHLEYVAGSAKIYGGKDANNINATWQHCQLTPAILGNTMTFTVTEDDLPGENVYDSDSGSWIENPVKDFTFYKISYTMKVKDREALTEAALGSDAYTVVMGNTITSVLGSDSTTVEYTPKVLEKYKGNEVDGRIEFTIKVNEAKADLATGDVLVLTDTMHNLSAHYEDIHVAVQDYTTPVTMTNEAGQSVQLPYFNMKGDVITFYLPDNYETIITYTAMPVGEVDSNGYIHYNNVANLNGYEKEVDNWARYSGTAAGTATNYGVKLYKANGYINSQKLAGAKFKLYIVDEVDEDGNIVSGSPLKDNSTGKDYIVTSSDTGEVLVMGDVTVQGWNLKPEQRYYLLEVEAPEGCAIDNTKYEFVISQKGYANYTSRYVTAPDGSGAIIQPWTYYNGDVLTVKNYPIKGILDIKKTFEGINSATMDDNQKAAIRFEVYKQKNDGSWTKFKTIGYDEFVTDTYTIGDLDAGTYKVLEIVDDTTCQSTTYAVTHSADSVEASGQYVTVVVSEEDIRSVTHHEVNVNNTYDVPSEFKVYKYADYADNHLMTDMKLAGAEFGVFPYNAGDGTLGAQIGENYVTNSRGRFSVVPVDGSIVYDTVYALKEVKAPEGYQLSEQVYYFCFLGEGTSTLPSNAPADTVAIPYKTASTDQQIPNAFDTTTLGVRKLWQTDTLEEDTEKTDGVTVRILRSAYYNKAGTVLEESETGYFPAANSTFTVSYATDHWALSTEATLPTGVSIDASGRLTGLPTVKVLPNGALLYYKYTVEEAPVNGYNASYAYTTELDGSEQVTITNRPNSVKSMVKVHARKKWVDPAGNDVTSDMGLTDGVSLDVYRVAGVLNKGVVKQGTNEYDARTLFPLTFSLSGDGTIDRTSMVCLPGDRLRVTIKPLEYNNSHTFADTNAVNINIRYYDGSYFEYTRDDVNEVLICEFDADNSKTGVEISQNSGQYSFEATVENLSAVGRTQVLTQAEAASVGGTKVETLTLNKQNGWYDESEEYSSGSASTVYTYYVVEQNGSKTDATYTVDGDSVLVTNVDKKLKVDKKWLKADDTEISNKTDGTVEYTLYQSSAAIPTVNIDWAVTYGQTGWGQTPIDLTATGQKTGIKKGSNVTIKLSAPAHNGNDGSLDLPDSFFTGGASITKGTYDGSVAERIYTINNIQHNVSIRGLLAASSAVAITAKITVDESTASEALAPTVTALGSITVGYNSIEANTVDSAYPVRVGNAPWSILISKLPSADDDHIFTYYVAETAINGFDTTYEPAGVGVAPGSTITVKNQKQPTGSLRVMKDFGGFDYNDLSAEQKAALANITFTVTGPDGYSTNITLAEAMAGKTISDLPLGTYTVTETRPDDSSPSGYLHKKTTVKVNEGTATETLTATATVSANTVTNVTYVNEYSSVTADLTVTKQIDQANSATEAVTFYVGLFAKATDTTPITAAEVGGTNPMSITFAAGSADTSKTATFTGLTVGTTYYVFETDSTGKKVTTSDKTSGYAITAGDVSGKSVEIAVGGNTATINNTYSATNTVDFKAEKVFTNGNLGEHTFTFKLTQVTGNNQTAPANSPDVGTGEGKIPALELSATETQTTDATSGTTDTVTFNTITFTKNSTVDETGDYWFLLEEDVPDGVDANGVKDGIKYDRTQKWIKVTVVDAGNGTLTVTKDPAISNGVDGTWTNEQLGSVKVTKAFSGIASLPDGFKITAAWQEDGTNKTRELTLSTEGMTGAGTASNPYTWQIDNLPIGTEVTFTEENIQIDQYTLKVNGTAMVDGTATTTATVVSGSEIATGSLVNDYEKKPGSLAITKAVTNGSNATGTTFTFEVTLKNSDDTPFTGVVQVVDSTRTTAAEVTPSDGKLTVTVTGTGTATITEIPDGTKYVITEPTANLPVGWQQVGEVAYNNSNKTITANTQDTATVTNKEVRDIEVTKTWSGTENWPEGMTVEVTLSATDMDSNTQTLSNDRKSYKWTNLPKYNDQGKAIAYTVTETAVKYNDASVGTFTNQYVVTVGGTTGVAKQLTTDDASVTIDNTPKTTTVTGAKTWLANADYTKDNPTLELTRTTETNSTPEVVYAEGTNPLQPTWDNGTYTYSGLRQYSPAGEEYSYAVRETGFTVIVPGENDSSTTYTYTVAEDGMVTCTPAGGPKFSSSKVDNSFTNTELMEITVRKVWTLNGAPVSGTPKTLAGQDITSISFDLYKKDVSGDNNASGTKLGTYAVGTDNNWTVTIPNLPKYRLEGNTLKQLSYYLDEIKDVQLSSYNTTIAITDTSTPVNAAQPLTETANVTITNSLYTVALPATGGMGTGVVYGAGAALMLLAVLGLILLNRKRTDGEGIR